MNEILENADILTIILHNQLERLIALRVEDQSEYHNFSLSWFCDSIPRLTALVTLNRHVIADIKYVDMSTTLLCNPFIKYSSFIEVIEIIGDMDR